MRSTKLLVLALFALMFSQCSKTDSPSVTPNTKIQPVKLSTPFLEDFETGTKTSYTAANVTVTTGIWNLNDALIGNLSTDAKDGSWSCRARNSATVTMEFDKTTGAGAVSIKHAIFGSDASGSWQLWYSINSGSTWTQTGSTVSTTSTTLATANFTINVTGNVRLQIRKTDAGSNRINFDDISIADYSGGSGNPVPTTTSLSPASATAGGAAFTLTVNGTNFISGSVINWNSTALTTTFVSATKLTATVPAADIASSGTASVTVFNTTPGGGTSNAQTFTINAASGNPVPSIVSLSPSSTTAGGSAFTLTVTGTNYITGSVVKWNSTSLTTTYVSATTVTAPITATMIATAGTASVTVFNPTPGGGTSNASTFTINSSSTHKKYLFDATHAETAGNADWVIDEDNSTPQRIPTPAQSTVTSSTSESYWTGALSSWGIALVKLGHTVETLPSSGSITYGNTSNAQDLANYDVFVVDEPNKVFSTTEKTAIINFVKNGGGLFMISDHTGSDRDNDGWDSPAIWNDLMTNNSIASNPFGFSIDLTNISQTTTNVLSSSSNTIINGSQGTVSTIEFDNGATITTNTSANSTVQGLVWESGVSQGSTKAMAASSTYGSGRVFVITDSSPADDGTGASGNSLFPGWTTDSHAALHLNASLWLGKL